MLSANTLFHFTKTVDVLTKILHNGFRPSYCRESFGKSGILNECYTPMICFCDIPLSQVHTHVDKYGKYGLGMTVDWGVEKDISPVTYVSGKSSIYNAIDSMNTMFISVMGTETSQFQRIDPFGQSEAILRLASMIYSTTTLQCYLKLYKGIDSVSGLINKYYDEKEWRYLPPYSIFPDSNPLFLRIPESSLQHEHGRINFMINCAESLLKMPIQDALEQGKKAVLNHFLTFTPQNLKYIIVRYEHEIREVINALKARPDRYSSEDIERLSSRILTYNQIKEDF